MKRVVAASCGLAILAMLSADYAGRRYLQGREAWKDRELAQELARANQFRRVVLTEEPIEQNAAIWYRRAFGRFQLAQVERAGAVAKAAAGAYSDGGSASDAVVADVCDEARSQRVRSALRCTVCNWDLVRSGNEDRLDGTRAWLLGNCLILYGHVKASRHEWMDASRSYLEALAFACDLGQAGSSTSEVGMAIAKPALEALVNVTRHADRDSRVRERIREELSRFDKNLPTVSPGIHLAALRAAINLDIDAKAYIARRPFGSSYFVPWHALAAWRRSESEPVLQLLAQLSDATDPGARERLATAVDSAVDSSKSQSVRDAVSSDWVGAVKSEAYLRDVYRATEAALR